MPIIVYIVEILVDSATAPRSGQFVYHRIEAHSVEAAEIGARQWAAAEGFRVLSAFAQPSISQIAA